MDEAVSSLRLSTDEAGSNTIFTRNESVPNFTIKLTIPGYTAIFYDGSKKFFENSDHVLVVFSDVYVMANLVADVAARTKWGTCQEAKFWYWNVEKKGMVCVVTDADLKSVFQQFSETKVACFVVEFAIKPVYKCNIALDFKMKKLPVRRAPDVSHESASSGESDDESVEEEDNVDPALMDDEDIFMEDNEVFVSLGLRAEEVAARKNMEQDGLGLNVDDVVVDDHADDEPRFTIDKENPKIKDLPPVDLLDKLRQMTMDLWDKRRRIGDKLSGNILPTIIKQLNAKTRGLGHMRVHKGAHTAEIFGTNYDLTPWRHVVELNIHTCSCGEWQMTGKPCPHALAFLQMIPDVDMSSYVHEYYSVERFRAAYNGTIPPMTDKSQWPQVDMGFKLLPPPLKRAPGRQRKNRYKASHEPGATKQKRCNACGEFGHRENGNCPLNEPKKRKRVSKPKRKPQRPKIVAGETISPGSITRRLSDLVEEGQVHEVGTASTSTNSARRSLNISQEDGSTSNN